MPAVDPELQERLRVLEERVKELEDQLAIVQVINSWGPAVDTGASGAAAALFDADGVLESDLSRLEGPAGVEAMVESEGQQSLIRRGCAHVQTAPIISVEGDRATAIAYSQVYLHSEHGHEVWRVSANQWEFRRTAGGWRVTRRLNRVIDGSPESQGILQRALGDRGER
jgi:SnoaL-like protein